MPKLQIARSTLRCDVSRPPRRDRWTNGSGPFGTFSGQIAIRVQRVMECSLACFSRRPQFERRRWNSAGRTYLDALGSRCSPAFGRRGVIQEVAYAPPPARWALALANLRSGPYLLLERLAPADYRGYAAGTPVLKPCAAGFRTGHLSAAGGNTFDLALLLRPPHSLGLGALATAARPPVSSLPLMAVALPRAVRRLNTFPLCWPGGVSRRPRR